MNSGKVLVLLEKIFKNQFEYSRKTLENWENFEKFWETFKNKEKNLKIQENLLKF